jgi:hypothetical protein
VQVPVSDSFAPEVPASDQQFLLSIFSLAVDYYQPRIEQRTGTELGPISVWEHAKLQQHQIEYYRKSLGFVRALFCSRKIQQYCDAVRQFAEDQSRNVWACYYRNAIYISFSTGVDHDDWIAEIVVHELAHALWEKLGGPTSSECAKLPETERKQVRLLAEGFATFAQSIWFRDLYPLYARIDVGYSWWRRDSVYEQGIQKIRQIVKDRGSKVFLEIPSRWHEL